MSERKVLNKYYPPDFDPNKIPRLKRPKNRQFSIRIMAPFNMRCGNCGEYIYKGKKFNSRQERVEDEDYLGLMIFRFYIKCPRCVSEISFKTDPQNCDYALEAGATRNFEALRTAERLAEQELKEKEEEEKNNPMKVLENRTKASQQEMEMLETLEELRELNSRHAKVDHEEILRKHKAYEEQLRQLQDEEDEQFIRSIFGKSMSGETIKRVHDDDRNDEKEKDGDLLSPGCSSAKLPCFGKPTDILTELVDGSEMSKDTKGNAAASVTPNKEPAVWQKSIGGLSKKNLLLGIVKKKKPPQAEVSTDGTRSPVKQMKEDSSEAGGSNVCLAPTSNTVSCSSEINTPSTTKESDKSTVNLKTGTDPLPTGLGMLGAYSDSSNDESS